MEVREVLVNGFLPLQDNHSSIFKGEDHKDRISYPRYYGGFEEIGWEKSGSVIMSCLSSYSKHSCINKRILFSFGGRPL